MGLWLAVIRFVIFLLVCKLALRLYHFIRFCITVNKIPGPLPHPLTVLILPFQFLKTKPEDRFFSFYDLCMKYKKGIIRTCEAVDEVVFNIYKPQHLEVILSSNRLITKATLYEYLQPWFGDGILTSTGDKWMAKRKLANPAFHFEVLNQFSKVMSQNAEILNQAIEEEMKNNPSGPIDFSILAIRYSFDTICETIMGINLDLQRNGDSDDYSHAAHKASEISIKRINVPWLQPDWIFSKTKDGDELQAAVDAISKFTVRMIKKKREARKAQKKLPVKKVEEVDDFLSEKREKRPLLDLLLDLKEKDESFMTEAELIDEVNTFMFGGYDTVAAAIGWVIFNLGNNPEIQERVHEELDAMFGDSKEPATNNQIIELKYLERVIKESLRLNPSGPTVARRLTEDVVLDGQLLPKGCIVHLQIFVLHRDPEVWADPLKFDPDRFLPEIFKERHAYSYIPFSSGPRNCIGQNFAMMELKVVLTALLRKWRVKSARTQEEMKMIWSATLLPFDGNPIYFTPK